MTTKEFPTYSQDTFLKSIYWMGSGIERKGERLGPVPNTYTDFRLRRQSPTCLHGAH